MSEQQLARILDPAYLDGLDDMSTAEVRQRRAECEDAEEGVSYARRLLQGRLDILRADLVRRDDVGDGDASNVLANLAAILSHDQKAPADSSQTRATRLRVPPSAEHHEQQLDEIVDEADLAGLDGVPTADLAALVDRLSEHERALSGLRRQLFSRIDDLRAELARRYKDGRADVSQILIDQDH